jgi:hypothetical protein
VQPPVRLASASPDKLLAAEDFDDDQRNDPVVTLTRERIFVPSPEPGDQTIVESPETPPPQLFCGQAANQTVIADDERPCTNFCRFLPEGMVPWIGPRTPASRRYRCIGQPLIDSSWRERPVMLAFVLGGAEGSPFEKGHVIQDAPGLFIGFAGGWDYDYYWGIEKRFNYADVQIANANHTDHRSSQAFYGEYRLNWYPLGDTRWRPVVFSGPGLVDYFYRDDTGTAIHRTEFLVCYGLGLKYLWSPKTALRIEILDDYTVGNWNMSPMHNVAINAGFEMRFGEGWHWWHLYTKRNESW